MQEIKVQWHCDGCDKTEETPIEQAPTLIQTHSVAFDSQTYETERCERCWNSMTNLWPLRPAGAKSVAKSVAKPPVVVAKSAFQAANHKGVMGLECDQPKCKSVLASRASWTAHRRRQHGIVTRPRRAA